MADSCDYNTDAKVREQHYGGTNTQSDGEITGGGICAKTTKADTEIASGPFGLGSIF